MFKILEICVTKKKKFFHSVLDIIQVSSSQNPSGTYWHLTLKPVNSLSQFKNILITKCSLAKPRRRPRSLKTRRSTSTCRPPRWSWRRRATRPLARAHRAWATALLARTFSRSPRWSALPSWRRTVSQSEKSRFSFLPCLHLNYPVCCLRVDIFLILWAFAKLAEH